MPTENDTLAPFVISCHFSAFPFFSCRLVNAGADVGITQWSTTRNHVWRSLDSLWQMAMVACVHWPLNFAQHRTPSLTYALLRQEMEQMSMPFNWQLHALELILTKIPVFVQNRAFFAKKVLEKNFFILWFETLGSFVPQRSWLPAVILTREQWFWFMQAMQ